MAVLKKLGVCAWQDIGDSMKEYSSIKKLEMALQLPLALR